MATQIVKDLSTLQTTSDGLASCFGLTRPRIVQLAKEGILVKDNNSKYEVKDNVLRYLDYVKNGGKTSGSDDEFQASYWQEKSLHEKAKRELTEMRLLKLQGKMHSAIDVELVMTEMLTNLRAQLLGMPSQMAPQLVGKSQEEICEVITREVESKLIEIKDYNPQVFQEECVDDGSAEDG